MGFRGVNIEKGASETAPFVSVWKFVLTSGNYQFSESIVYSSG